MENLLKEIYRVVQDRKKRLPEGSYTASLFKEGKKKILRKFLEEANEVVLAATFENQKALTEELADLWFHVIVLMVQEGVTINEVMEVLRKRRQNSNS